MDNRMVGVTSIGNEDFKKVLSLFGSHQVVGYKVEGKRLIFYWSTTGTSGVTPALFPMDIDQASSFALGWLKNQDYGSDPGIDGDCKKGWRIYCEQWGHVGGEWQAFAAIEPVWAMYGK